MRNILIIFLFTASVCLAQESFHNDEFGFTIEMPVGWNISFENEWSNEVKDSLERVFDGKTLLMLNPSDVKAPKTPCIQVQGRKLQKTTTSEAINTLKHTGEEFMTYSAEYLAESLLGRNVNQYDKMDTFYDYDSSRKAAIAKILYQHKREDIYFLSARAKFIGLQRVIDFRGYWEGDDPESFWQTFNEVIDSFEFDQDARPGGILGAAKEIGDMSKEQKFNLIWKWAGIILTISIIIGIARYVLGR